MKKKLLAYLLFLFPLVAFAGHAHAETIKVVFDTAYAPFEFKDSDQTYKGIDVEILDKVAEINGWDLDKSFPGFDAAVNAVQAGQADAIMAGMTKTTEREKVFTMSDTYYDTKVVIATKKADKITKYSQLKGKKVGVKNGTAAQRLIKTRTSTATVSQLLIRVILCTIAYQLVQWMLLWTTSRSFNMPSKKVRT